MVVILPYSPGMERLVDVLCFELLPVVVLPVGVVQDGWTQVELHVDVVWTLMLLIQMVSCP